MRSPLNPHQLSNFATQQLGISLASRALIDGHQSPLDYLAHVFFQGRGGFGAHGATEPVRALDSVVWASRGGGKTFLGAVATALDLVFKPGIEIRILGGSLEQSRRMHAHLRRLFARPALAAMVQGKIGETRLTLTNGSSVELLAQSHTAVRGTRVQTLRCDEVELFKADVFEAAMLTTMSKEITIPGVGPTEIAGSIECLSTMHVPFGLMSHLVKDNSRRVFKWGVVDVLAECEATRACAGCALWAECQGRAKRGGAEGQSGEVAKGEGSQPAPKPTVREKRALNEVTGATVPDRAVCIGTSDAWRAKSATAPVAALAARVARRRSAAVCAPPASKRCSRTKRARNAVTGTGACARAGSVGSPDTPRVRRATAPVAALAARTGSERTAGHLSIDDAIRMKRRVSLSMWNTEMLCLEPSRADTVFPEFDRAVHVFASWEGEGGVREAESPLEWLDPLRTVAIESVFRPAPATFVCGIDFGFRAPTVILWAAVDGRGVLRILDERHVTRETTKQHAAAILMGNGRLWRVPDWIGADPAGRQRQTQSGRSDVQVLQESGLVVKTRGSEIQEGINLIRERLRAADGAVRLLVHERCTKLIEAFAQYHYRQDDPEDQRPVKDGHDHAIDALRYLVLNLDGARQTQVSKYA